MAKILIVDDSQSVLQNLRIVLEGAGYEVIEADDGRPALELLKVNRDVGLVISDLHMPGMTGLAMLSAAKTELTGRSFKAFILTTDASVEMKAEGKKLGVTAWILKPFLPDRLVQAVDRVLGG